MGLVLDVYIDKGNLKILGELPVTSDPQEIRAFLSEIKYRLLGDKNIDDLAPGLMHRELTEEEAAKYIGKSRSFLQKCRREGRRSGKLRGPKYTRDTSRTIRYPVDELERWLASRERYEFGCEERDYSEDRDNYR